MIETGCDAPQVEVDVAEATNVEAREDTARGGFGVETRHASRQFEDVAAAGGEVAQLITLNDADRHRHLLEIFRAAFGGNDDFAELIVGRRAGGAVLRAGGGDERRSDERGRKHQQRAAGVGESHDRNLIQ